MPRHRVLVVTWAPGGNVPPLLAAASILRDAGHHVEILASAATSAVAERAGFEVVAYRRSLAPDTSVAFEDQAGAMMAAAAGPDIGRDVHEVLAETRPDLAIVDCMLPAGIAAGLASDTPTASLVHFLFGLARRQMLAHGGAWTTDLAALNATHRALGLPEAGSGLDAWEAPQLVLVTAPRWLDVALDYPRNVIHAGPLGVHARPRDPGVGAGRARPRVLVSFSTTVMSDQLPTLQRVCDGILEAEVEATLTLGPAVDQAALRTPDNVRVVAFADHDELLRECAAVITHGGLGTTLRALAHGVPQLLLPLGRDQEFNAARVSDLGAGIRLSSGAAPSDVRAALERLLREPGFAAAAGDAASRIATGDPDRRAVDALEGCARRCA